MGGVQAEAQPENSVETRENRGSGGGLDPMPPNPRDHAPHLLKLAEDRVGLKPLAGATRSADDELHFNGEIHDGQNFHQLSA
jgi:hypothetical protein